MNATTEDMSSQFEPEEIEALETLARLTPLQAEAAIGGARTWFAIDDQAFDDYCDETGCSPGEVHDWKGDPAVHAEQAAEECGTDAELVEMLISVSRLLDEPDLLGLVEHWRKPVSA